MRRSNRNHSSLCWLHTILYVLVSAGRCYYFVVFKHFFFFFLTFKKNVLHGQHEADKIWTKEGFYTIVIFLSTFFIIVTCLMVSPKSILKKNMYIYRRCPILSNCYIKCVLQTIPYELAYNRFLLMSCPHFNSINFI